MKIKKYILLTFALIAMSSVSAQKITVHGEYASAPDGRMIYLMQGHDVMDSAIIKNGKFRFSSKTLYPEEYYVHDKVAKHGAILYLDDGDTDLDIPANFSGMEVHGNDTHVQTWQIVSQLLEADVTHLSPLQADQLCTAASMGTMSSAFILRKFIDVFAYTFPEVIDRDYEKLPENVKNSKVGKDTKEEIERVRGFMVGGTAPDFTLPTPDGKIITLSEFVKGKKVILLDFWASWCGPCRAKNPAIRVAYEDFHDEGFDAISVSIDTDHDKWIKAIKNDRMPWTQVTEPKGYNGNVAKRYSINGIPTYFLIDSNRHIIANSVFINRGNKSIRNYIEDICE